MCEQNICTPIHQTFSPAAPHTPTSSCSYPRCETAPGASWQQRVLPLLRARPSDDGDDDDDDAIGQPWWAAPGQSIVCALYIAQHEQPDLVSSCRVFGGQMQFVIATCTSINGTSQLRKHDRVPIRTRVYPSLQVRFVKRPVTRPWNAAVVNDRGALLRHSSDGHRHACYYRYQSLPAMYLVRADLQVLPVGTNSPLMVFVSSPVSGEYHAVLCMSILTIWTQSPDVEHTFTDASSRTDLCRRRV